jgi:hypothetical protein
MPPKVIGCKYKKVLKKILFFLLTPFIMTLSFIGRQKNNTVKAPVSSIFTTYKNPLNRLTNKTDKQNA